MAPSNSATIWRNWHETVTQTVREYVSVRNSNESASTIGAYNETGRALQGFIRRAIDEDTSLRAVGGGWSFTSVAAADGIMLATQRLNYRFGIGAQSLARPYAPDRMPVFLQAGISIADVNKYLARRGQALPTSGASNGQTMAGALATGTHGAAIDVGAVPDYVVAMHLATAPDGPTVWLERKRYRVLKDTAIAHFDAKLEDDEDIFDAALVSFGSFGLVLGVLIEPVPLYWLHAWRQPIVLDDSLWDAITAGTFDNMALPGANGRRPYHLELILNPNDPAKVMATVMYHEATRPPNSKRPTLSGGFGKGDSALDFIGRVTDKYGKSTATIAKLFDKAYAPYTNIAGTPGETFSDTSTRGRSASSAMGVPLDRAREAFETAADIVRRNQAPAIVGMRFVKATRAILGFTHHQLVTCVLEVDGAFSNRTRQAHQEVWHALIQANIPHTFHWGKMHNLDAQRVRDRYGAARVDKWVNARQALLTAEQRRAFATSFTDQLNLSD